MTSHFIEDDEDHVIEAVLRHRQLIFCDISYIRKKGFLASKVW